MDNIYLDNGATTKVKTEVLNEMMPYLTTEYGNPSSLYSIGRKAKKAIEKSRRQVAELIIQMKFILLVVVLKVIILH